MKKCTLFLMAMCACASLSFAQVLKINQMGTDDAMERIFVKEILPGEVIEMATEENFIEFDSDVINMSEIAQTVNLILEVADGYTDGIDISGCWKECLFPWNFRFDPVELPSQGAEVFKIDYNTNGIENSQALVICTFVVEGYDDFVFYVRFGDAQESVTEPVITKNQAYPNPATSVVTIDYALNKSNAQISLYNILGVRVHEQPLDSQEGTATINISDFAPGVYFYTIKVDGKAVETKKLVISR
ncbi:MAG: T9SS type A sorting domain-containing protein [Bacteroidales bacterium]|nr:T9SS type A sorting domain-containing protein [Bacteroidales bacterium]